MIPNTCSAVLLPLVFTYVKDEIRIAIWESLGYFPSEYIKELHGIKNTSAKHFFFLSNNWVKIKNLAECHYQVTVTEISIEFGKK